MNTPSGGLGPFEFALPEKFTYQGSRIGMKATTQTFNPLDRVLDGYRWDARVE